MSKTRRLERHRVSVTEIGQVGTSIRGSVGYLSSHADGAIRRELCEDAVRLTTILAGHLVGTTPETSALPRSHAPA